MRALPPLRAVVALEATVRLGGMAPAAAELGITPSAVSHRIAGLEAHLGQELFRRAAGRLEATPRGRRLAARFALALDEIAAATREAGVDDGAAAGATRAIGVQVAASLAAKWLRPRLGRFLAAHPGIALRILDVSGPPAAFGPDLQLALVYAADAPPGAEPLLAEKLRPLCSPALRRRLPKRPGPADVLALPLLHSRNALGWTEWCRRMGIAPPPERGLRFDRSHMAIDAAREGLGIVLESDLLTEAERRTRALVPATRDAGAALPGPGYALVLPPGPPSGATLAFIQWLREEARRQARVPAGDAGAGQR